MEGLKKAVLIKNGSSVATFDVTGKSGRIGYSAPVTGTGWYALKVVEQDGDLAHTNPIWVK